MLTPVTPETLEAHIDWAYSLALDPARSGYPTYADGIKTREDFIRAARRAMEGENRELLLFRADGEVCGWIQWFWQPGERYAQTDGFLTGSHTDRALTEFLAHAAERCPGYALHLGFPFDNARAVEWLRQSGARVLERSVHLELFFDRYAPREAPVHVSCMSGSDDEAAFCALHTATDMFWTAERILADRENWHVYLYGDGDAPTAALYAHGISNGWPEIFGMAGDVTPTAYRALMTACLNDCKAAGCAHMTYFEEDESKLPILAELGFTIISRYVCYQKIL